MSAPKKYAFRQRHTKHNYSLIGAELSDDDDVLGPVTPAQRSAAAAGLDARALSHMEERDFAHVTKGGAGKIAQYLSVRCATSTRGGGRRGGTPPSIVPGAFPSIVEASADFFLAIDPSIANRESRLHRVLG